MGFAEESRDNAQRAHRSNQLVAFSPDGQVLVSGGDDWSFRLWDIAAGRHIATLEHVVDRTRSQIKEVAFSPDGARLATAGLHVKLWDIRTQNEIATLRHNDWVWALAFSPNGELLAAGDDEGSVKIWDVQDREVIAELQADTNTVYAVAFSPDGRNALGELVASGLYFYTFTAGDFTATRRMLILK